MLRFKNKLNGVPATPKSWWVEEKKRKISWDSTRETWEDFINKLMAYLDANQVPRPDIAVVEDHICRQVSGWACISSEKYDANVAVPHRSAPNYTRCGTCGKRKETA